MRYDLLAQDALRGVVRAALLRVRQSGLPGEHHFYISFNTRHPDVRLSERLRNKYEKEMTIVLQHQFWNLQVGERDFEVELSFNEIAEKLFVSRSTVKYYITNIFSKLGVGNRSEAISMALRQHIITSE